MVFFFMQKTSYEMRISDWSSDVCSSDLPEHTRPVGCRDVLLRLQNNIKLRYVQDERSVDSLAILETMLMIAPERAGLWRVAGVLHAHLAHMRAALLAFDHLLELAAPGDPGRTDISDLLRQLRRHLHYAPTRTPV